METILAVENVGVAPIYHKLPLKIRLVGEKTYAWDTGVDVREWKLGTSQNKMEINLPSDMQKGEYKIEISLGGGEYPTAYFATDAKEENGWYEVGRTEIE